MWVRLSLQWVNHVRQIWLLSNEITISQDRRGPINSINLFSSYALSWCSFPWWILIHPFNPGFYLSFAVLYHCLAVLVQEWRWGDGYPKRCKPYIMFYTSCAWPLHFPRSCFILAPHALRTMSLDTPAGIMGTVTVFISGESQLEELIEWDSVLLEPDCRLTTPWLHGYDGVVTHSLQRMRPAESNSLWKALPCQPPGLCVHPVFAHSNVWRLK